jgi:glutathione S-transferase
MGYQAALAATRLSKRRAPMKLYVLPPSPRAFKVIALKNHLGIECEMHIVDLRIGDQLTPEYIAMNPNKKMPVLEDDGFVLWESNAILFYLASKRPESGLWPSGLQEQANVLRWLAWESSHWDAESCGMVGYEKVSKGVLGLGSADPAFIERGAQNFDRFAAVLNDHLKSRKWLTGNCLTIADFSIVKFPEIGRWYEGLAALPAWGASMVPQ